MPSSVSPVQDTHPSLFLSMMRGATARTYVHVQIMRRMTRRRDWKLNNADFNVELSDIM